MKRSPRPRSAAIESISGLRRKKTRDRSICGASESEGGPQGDDCARGAMTAKADKLPTRSQAARLLCFAVSLGATCAVVSPTRAGAASAHKASLIASPEAGWPQFRGPRRDGVSEERGLLQ